MTGAPRGAGVLTDPVADRMLAEEGYATVRFVTPEQASEALRSHGALRGSEGEGFDADLNNPDTAYRRRVAGLLSSQLGDAVARTFRGFEPFLWSFLCKWPHDQEGLYLHRGWMFVNEPTGARSYSIWVALQDIGPGNGMLRVLPRSHLLRDELTGSGLSESWTEHRDVIERYLVPVPVRAGDAVVMDHGVVHCSDPNPGATARVAVGCAVHRPTDQLVHFRRIDDARADRFDVDPEFFVTYTPAQLESSPPSVAVAATVPAVVRHVSPAELAGRLDALGDAGVVPPERVLPRDIGERIARRSSPVMRAVRSRVDAALRSRMQR